VLDNGYIRVYSEDEHAQLNDFSTNDANYVHWKLSTRQPALVEYLYWPNHRMGFSIDGVEQKVDIRDGLLVAEVATGEHVLEITYSHKKMQFFMVIYFLYWTGFLLALVAPLFKKSLPAPFAKKKKRSSLSIKKSSL
jgi:hypothetical protein